MRYPLQLSKLTRYLLCFLFLGTLALISSCSALSKSEESNENIASGTTKIIAIYSDCEELATKEEKVKCMCNKTPEYCKKFENSDELPYAIIENIPIYPGCEDFSTQEERTECMNDKLHQLDKNKKSKTKDKSERIKKNPSINERSKSLISPALAGGD